MLVFGVVAVTGVISSGLTYILLTGVNNKRVMCSVTKLVFLFRNSLFVTYLTVVNVLLIYYLFIKKQTNQQVMQLKVYYVVIFNNVEFILFTFKRSLSSAIK